MAAPKCRNCERTTLNASGLCGICLPPGAGVNDAALASLAGQADLIHAADSEEFGGDVVVEEEERPPRTEFRIPDENLEGLRARIQQYQKRASKLGVPAPELEVLSAEWVDEKTSDGVPTGQVRLVHTVKVTGESPHFDGWKLRAVIDFDHEEPDQPNLVHAIDDEVDPSWRRMKNTCEHCDSDRRRNKVVVVEHDNGERKAVGTTCLRDFLGSSSPESIAAWAEMLSGLGDMAESYEEREAGAYYEPRIRPDHYMGWVVRAVKETGWRSRRDERGSTADLARQMMEDVAKGQSIGAYGKAVPPPDPLTEEELAEAEAAIEWAMSIPEDSPDSYKANLRAVAGKQGWRWKDIGLGASIVAAKAREEGREREAVDHRARALAAGHLGKPNEKLTFRASVVKTVVVDGMWGSKTGVIMVTDEGHDVIWWNSGKSKPGPSAGRTYNFKATVAEHGHYNGLPQTRVLRAKFEEVDDAQPAEVAETEEAQEPVVV